MNTCIKCGREIPDGELFCRECALNPGAISEDGHAMPAPRGKMQKPVVQPPKPKPNSIPTKPVMIMATRAIIRRGPQPVRSLWVVVP
mgnify:CR=1 FL=1